MRLLATMFSSDRGSSQQAKHMSRGLGGVINQAHLIHDQSLGRSSTRLHAPPGGHSSLGTSFSWGVQEDSVSVRNGRAGFQQQQSIMSPAQPIDMQDAVPRQAPPPTTPGSRGFGDTGGSSIRLHASPGGSNAMGSGFSWSDEPVGPKERRRSADAYAEYMTEQKGMGLPQTARSMELQVGSQVIYKQIGKAGIESVAVIVEIEPATSRKDNYRIRFEDGRERNTSQDRISIM